MIARAPPPHPNLTRRIRGSPGTPRRQAHGGGRRHRQFAVLIGRALRDLRIVLASVLERAAYLAVDVERVADRIVTADLDAVAAQESIVPHPVRQLMGHPRAALRTVVVGR